MNTCCPSWSPQRNRDRMMNYLSAQPAIKQVWLLYNMDAYPPEEALCASTARHHLIQEHM